jgi:hypothetical protein
MYKFPRNFWEDTREDGEPLARDKQGKVIVPSAELLKRQLEELKRLQDEQLYERRWSQR